MITPTDIPSPESVGANHDPVIRQILNKERSEGNQRQRFVVQFYSDWGWQNTRYRASDRHDALALADWLVQQDDRWMPGGSKRATRVIDRLELD